MCRVPVIHQRLFCGSQHEIVSYVVAITFTEVQKKGALITEANREELSSVSVAFPRRAFKARIIPEADRTSDRVELSGISGIFNVQALRTYREHSLHAAMARSGSPVCAATRARVSIQQDHLTRLFRPASRPWPVPTNPTPPLCHRDPYSLGREHNQAPIVRLFFKKRVQFAARLSASFPGRRHDRRRAPATSLTKSAVRQYEITDAGSGVG